MRSVTVKGKRSGRLPRGTALGRAAAVLCEMGRGENIPIRVSLWASSLMAEMYQVEEGYAAGALQIECVQSYEALHLQST